METEATPLPLTPLEVEMLAALKLCERYMSGPRAPKYLQEPIAAARTAIAKAQARAAAPAPEVEG